MSEIGSLSWRRRNYGIYRTLRYLLQDGFLGRRRLNLPTHPTLTGEIALIRISEITGLSRNEVGEVERLAKSFLKKAQIRLSETNSVVKSGVAGDFGPVGRLTLIGASLWALKPHLYLETGTQYGVSADFAQQFVTQKGLPTKVISVEVRETKVVALNSGYEQAILDSPYGKNFVSLLLGLSRQFSSTVFAHDSDHSYEHMSWELSRAEEHLKPIAYICDDVQQHNAFLNFAKQFRTAVNVLSFESQLAVGYIHVRDPDGT